MRRAETLLPAGFLLLLLTAACGLTLNNMQTQLPVSQWLAALRSPDADNINQMLFHFSLLPRISVALLVGAGLGLAGLLFQQVLRNPLAEPTTLGVASGAQLGITVATLWTLPLAIQPWVALMGAAAVGLVVFGVAWGRRLSPVTLILAGLVLSLYCGAVNQLLALFHYDQLQNMFLWSTGSLNQQDWSTTQILWPRLLAGLILTLLLLRPLTLMGLDDGVARNLGLALSLTRLAILSLAIMLSAQLVSAAGIVGFIGLFSPLLAKMIGARRLLSRLLLATLIGALILWLADQVAILLASRWREISTGTLTALVGAPILLWLLPRLRSYSVPITDQIEGIKTERQALCRWAAGGIMLLIVVAGMALLLGRNEHGLSWLNSSLVDAVLPWRWPRVLAAMTAGIMLAVAGCLVQRLTGNAMASPEVLGISSGAAFGIVLMLFFVPGNAFGWMLPAGSLGAAVTLLLIMLAAGRGGFSPQRMLLAGVALSTAFMMLLMLMMASGDPRMASILTWISGSTYSVTEKQALQSLAVMVILLAIIPLCRRWLVILPLGRATAGAVGMAVTRAQMLVLLLAATLTAAATLIIGPLSFVGLMAPHIASMLGFRRAVPQIIIAALLGGGLMMVADWCGRMMLFPGQVPAGLLATFIGAPYFIYLLKKQSR